MGREQNSQRRAWRPRAGCERSTRVRRPRLLAPPHPSRSYRVRQRSREPSWLPRLPRSKGPRQPGKSKAARAHRRLRRSRTAPSLQGAGKHGRVPPFRRSRCDWLSPPSLSLPEAGRRRGSGGKGRDRGGPVSRALSPGEGVTGSAHASAGRAQPARGRKSSEARRAVPRPRRSCRSGGPHPLQRRPPSAAPAPLVSRPTEGAPHPSPVSVVRAMAPRKNAKGGGGGNSSSGSSSSSSGSGSGSPGAGTSGGSSSSPGARRGQRRRAGEGEWGPLGGGARAAGAAVPVPRIPPCISSILRVAPPFGAGRRPRSVGRRADPRGRAELGPRPWVGRAGEPLPG